MHIPPPPVFPYIKWALVLHVVGALHCSDGAAIALHNNRCLGCRDGKLQVQAIGAQKLPAYLAHMQVSKSFHHHVQGFTCQGR